MFFKSSFGELTKFAGNCVPKFSSKPGKGRKKGRSSETEVADVFAKNHLRRFEFRTLLKDHDDRQPNESE